MKPLEERSGEIVRIPLYQVLFLRIAEPRIIRILILAVYISCFIAGLLILMNRPEQFLHVLGDGLVLMFGILLVTGSILGAIAVLPGIWWLERVGIILLITCVSWYVVIISYLSASPLADAFVIGFGIFLSTRFIEIRGAQLAPKEG